MSEKPEVNMYFVEHWANAFNWDKYWVKIPMGKRFDSMRFIIDVLEDAGVKIKIA